MDSDPMYSSLSSEYLVFSFLCVLSTESTFLLVSGLETKENKMAGKVKLVISGCVRSFYGLAEEHWSQSMKSIFLRIFQAWTYIWNSLY